MSRPGFLTFGAGRKVAADSDCQVAARGISPLIKSPLLALDPRLHATPRASSLVFGSMRIESRRARSRARPPRGAAVRRSAGHRRASSRWSYRRHGGLIFRRPSPRSRARRCSATGHRPAQPWLGAAGSAQLPAGGSSTRVGGSADRRARAGPALRSRSRRGQRRTSARHSRRRGGVGADHLQSRSPGRGRRRIAAAARRGAGGDIPVGADTTAHLGREHRR